TVNSLFSGKFADVDTSSSSHTFTGIAITGNAATAPQGQWEYSTDTGTNWTAIPITGLSDTTALVVGSAVTNLIRFNPTAADYNGTPGALTVRLSDGTSFVASTSASNLLAVTTGTGGWSNAIALGTSVTQVNDAPSTTALDGDNVAFVEAVGVNVAGTAVYLDFDRNSGLVDIDLIPRAETKFNGATLTVQDKNVVDPHDFFVIQVGENNISISGGFTTPGGLKLFNNGSSVNYGVLSVASITNNSIDGKLVLTFNANASKAAVDAIVHNLAYSNDNDLLVSGNKDIALTFKDGNTTQPNNVQGTGGELSTTATVHIALSTSNDAPIFSAGLTLTGTEDTLSGAAGTSITTTPVTPTSLLTLLSSKFTDPEGYSSLAGVALSGFADSSTDASIRGSWQVSFDSGSNWTNLSALSTTVKTNTGGVTGISTAHALLLSESTRIQFVPLADGNTAGLTTPPRLTVFAVENSGPVGAAISDGLAASIVFSTNAATLTTYDTTASTTTHTAEARVAAVSVNIDVTITEKNDAPVLTGTTWSGILVEDPTPGIGTPTQLLVNAATVSDLDLATTRTLNNSTFGAGSITVHIASGATGDKFSLA
ncbi:hypothetical protein JZU54_01135, partial [bacterium]|nr:hypothetical protein [bacterium]